MQNNDFSGLARQSLERATYGELKATAAWRSAPASPPGIYRDKLHSTGKKKKKGIPKEVPLCDSGGTNLFIESLSLWSKPLKKGLLQSLVSPVTLLIGLQL
jgi:hypothetical protein